MVFFLDVPGCTRNSATLSNTEVLFTVRVRAMTVAMVLKSGALWAGFGKFMNDGDGLENEYRKPKWLGCREAHEYMGVLSKIGADSKLKLRSRGETSQSSYVTTVTSLTRGRS